MTDEQKQFLETLKEAFEAQPEEPDYADYETRGILSRDEFYEQQYQYNLVEDVRRLIND